MCIVFISLSILSIFSDVARGNPVQLTIHKVVASWMDAHDQCHRKGGVLASPINSEVLTAMKSLMRDNLMYHTGIRAGNSSETYLSVEGVPLEDMPQAVDNMIEKLDPFDGDCLAMDRYSIRLVSCCTRLQYMCIKRVPDATTTASNEEVPAIETTTKTYTELPAETTTAKNNGESVTTDSINTTICGPREEGYQYKPLPSKCYKVHNIDYAWGSANWTCENEGGRLAIVENEIDVQSILSMYNFTEWFWIHVGLRDFGDGDWRSVDGIRPVEELYNVWDEGHKPTNEPLNSHEYDEIYRDLCGTIHRSGVLSAFGCNSERPFICERIPTL